MVDLTPGIKVQPVRALLAWLGKQLNRDIVTKVDKLAKDFETHKVDSWRAEILDFANSCMNRRRHTKEEFDHILAVLDDYEAYVEEKKIKNGQVEQAKYFINGLYQKCCEKNSFLVVRPEDEEEGEG